APAHVESRSEPQEARPGGRHEMIRDLIGHGFVKGAAVAERPDVQLQRLQLHAQPAGDVFELQRCEVRLAGPGAQAGELRALHAVEVPGGKGKSDQTSAVRFVMSEVCVKQLCGGITEDVVGKISKASNRVGSAWVGLMFDNSDGTLSCP